MAPIRAITHAVVGMTAARASVYAVAVHWIVSSGAPNASESLRIAMLTIVMSSTDITVPMITTRIVRFSADEGMRGASDAS
ncbi:hypothetical protein SAURM35S_09887 [Streptomyces aurantiogriseus]